MNGTESIGAYDQWTYYTLLPQKLSCGRSGFQRAARGLFHRVTVSARGNRDADPTAQLDIHTSLLKLEA